jgi:hypothetical protein
VSRFARYAAVLVTVAAATVPLLTQTANAQTTSAPQAVRHTSAVSPQETPRWCMFRALGTQPMDIGTSVAQLYGGDEVWADINQFRDPGRTGTYPDFYGYSLRLQRWGFVYFQYIQEEYCQ